MLAGIHFQWINDKGETLEKILSMKKTFIGFIVPALLDKSLTNKGKDIFGRVYPEENYYPSWFVDALKQEAKNKNVIWAQEGFMHYCEPCFDVFEQNGGRENHGYPDPFHEHVCLNGNSQTLEEQKSAIKKGKEMLMDLTGIIPEVYCPSNHLHNKNTLLAAKDGDFKEFTTRNLLPFGGLTSYKDSATGLRVFPESKIGEGKNSAIVYTFYDHLVSGKREDYSKILSESDVEYLRFVDEPTKRVWLNQKMIMFSKKTRDWKRKFG